MEDILVFFQQHGLWLTLIAVVGIILLGVLKYCNVFKKFDEKVRHVLYLVISVGVSVVGSVIYLACVHQFDITYICTVAAAIFALNQAFYTIYDTTTLKELFNKLLDWIKSLINNKKKVDEIVDKAKEDLQGKEVDSKEDKKEE